eukprot:COSAG02_NODE_36517_length_453_cov_1.310734_2_plen_39_part_01
MVARAARRAGAARAGGKLQTSRAETVPCSRDDIRAPTSV